jgi:hypothetical protein
MSPPVVEAIAISSRSTAFGAGQPHDYSRYLCGTVRSRWQGSSGFALPKFSASSRKSSDFPSIRADRLN